MELNELKTPFPESGIQWRIGRAGWSGDRPWAMVLAYLDSRAIAARLDDVCGAGNWKNQFKEWHGSAQLCGISIKIDGEWVTKWDGAENTDIEAVKGGLSSAFKRAAVHWGIGAYLYDLDETFVECDGNTKKYPNYAKADGKPFSWQAPRLPAWALPPHPKDPEPNLMTNMTKLRKYLHKDVGCNDQADADVVCWFVSGGSYSTVGAATATEEDAKAVMNAVLDSIAESKCKPDELLRKADLEYQLQQTLENEQKGKS